MYSTTKSTLHSNNLKRHNRPPPSNSHKASGITEQSLLQCCIKLIMSISSEPPFLWHPYRISVTLFINHWRVTPFSLSCFFYQSWDPISPMPSEAECLAPSRINRTVALPQGLQGTRERKELPDSLSSFILSTCLWLSASEYSPEMAETGSISNDFGRTMLSLHTWGNCQLYRRREATFWNVSMEHNYKMKSNLNVLLDKNH